jgi:serine/threonine protein kinase/TPR repeat protein
MTDAVRFDHYEVLTRDDGSLYELGRGAMGVTYKALDTNLRIPVCLKVIASAHLHSEIARQRFIREARSAARLRNPHVAAVYHLGTAGGTYYYAMEYIDGETVDALIKRSGSLPPELALAIADQVARALAAAEPHGLVHRDIKPANLMVIREDGHLGVKVIDFGLAKSSLPDEESATLSHGGFVGTPHFASPEQLEERELDVRSDIYSLGVTLWFMLAGRVPFGGSMAQVMSAHLSKSPPFEKLNVPAPLARLLRRMLEKDCKNRPQNAAELRAEIATCLAELAASGSAAEVHEPVAIADLQDKFVTVADPALFAGEAVKFEVGGTVAGRYRILENLGDTNLGCVFHAQDQTRMEDVKLVVLHPSVALNGEVLSALERTVEKLVPRPHANVVRVDALETVGDRTFLVLEWFEGASLVELLRARRELEAGEVVSLLGPIALAVDHVLASGSEEIDPGLHHVLITFPKKPETDWMHQPEAQWPPHAVKVNPFSLRGAVAAGQTIVEAPAAMAGSATARAIRAVALIAYELLGGKLSTKALSGAGYDFKPLAGLTEAGNAVLRSALDTDPPFSSSRSFVLALSNPEASTVSRREMHTSVAAPRQSTVSPHAATTSPLPPPAAAPKRGLPVIPLGIAAAVAIGVAVFLALRNGPEPQRASADVVSPAISSATPVPDPVENPQPTPPTSTEPAPPSTQEMLTAAVADAKELEAKQDWPSAVAAWVKIARDFPENEAGKNNLNALCLNLRKRPNGLDADSFATLRAPLTDAAQLGALSAMMVLGENLRLTDQGEAFHWFQRAGELGDYEGMVQAGLMMSNGHGTEKNLEKAVQLFQAAAAQGQASGMIALGDCLLYGKGIAPDPARGVALLREVADKQDSRAYELLGTCYERGLGVKPDLKLAAEYYDKAATGGRLRAYANLGVLYIKGQGVPQNPRKAVELFRRGAEGKDPLCMFFLAQCYDGSGTGVAPNAAIAKQWYVKAAEAGEKRAIEWCEKNGVTPRTID